MNILKSNLSLIKTLLLIFCTSITVSLSACKTEEILKHGYIVDPQAVKLVPVGSSREQVLLTLGTPSTKATFDDEVYYYISQIKSRRFAFLKPKLINQKILAIYFDLNDTVKNIANYTLKDGKVFDTISRTTPTSGKDLTFLQSIFSGGQLGVAR